MSENLVAREPELGESFQHMFRAMLDGVHVCMPGRVEKYDPALQLADVTPMFIRVWAGPDDGPEIPVPYPVITDVAVHHLRGGGTFLATPLKAGDPVVLVFSNRSLDLWLESDGRTAVDPQDSRRHHISDAFCFPGVSTAKNAIPNASAADMVMGTEDGVTELHIVPGGSPFLKCDKLVVGSSGGSIASAKAPTVEARLAALEAFASSHVHVSTFGGGPTSTAPFSAGGGGASVASTRLFTDA